MSDDYRAEPGEAAGGWVVSVESERIHDILQRTWAREISADEALDEIEGFLVPAGSVPMPVDTEHAKGMALVGMKYLEDNAPEELKLPIVPRGWKLVPINPTHGMCLEGNKHLPSPGPDSEYVYRAMLAVAPAPSGEAL